jgi:hypothetical protein
LRGIKYVSLLEPSGYGVVGLRYLRGLVAADVPVTWTPMVPGRGWGLGYEPVRGRDVAVPGLSGLCNREIDYDTVIVHAVPEYFERWARLESKRGKRVFGYTVWETDRPPAHWPRLLNLMDGILVPCRWNRQVFERYGVTAPIAVVPHIAGTPAIEAAGAWDWDVRPGEYAFYTVNTWTNRKAPWLTIRAYLDAFHAEDPVVLIVKTSAQDFSRPPRSRWRLSRSRHRRAEDAVATLVREYRDPPRVSTATAFVEEAALTGLHARADCYTSLSRGEGWGLGAFDAAVHDRPIIMTGYGGQLD